MVTWYSVLRTLCDMLAVFEPMPKRVAIDTLNHLCWTVVIMFLNKRISSDKEWIHRAHTCNSNFFNFFLHIWHSKVLNWQFSAWESKSFFKSNSLHSSSSQQVTVYWQSCLMWDSINWRWPTKSQPSSGQWTSNSLTMFDIIFTAGFISSILITVRSIGHWQEVSSDCCMQCEQKVCLWIRWESQRVKSV